MGAYYLSDLPRLLQMQLLVAQANAGLDRKFAVEVLNFVVGATATDHSLDFRLKACALRNNLGESDRLFPGTS